MFCIQLHKFIATKKLIISYKISKYQKENAKGIYSKLWDFLVKRPDFNFYSFGVDLGNQIRPHITINNPHN